MKIFDKASLIASYIIACILGVLLIVVNPESINRFIMIIIGIFMIVTAIPGLFIGVGASALDTYGFVSSLIIMICGIVILFNPGMAFDIIIGILFIILPLVNLILAHDKKEQAKKDLPKYIFGVLVIIFSFNAVYKILYLVTGILILVFSTIYFVVDMIHIYKIEKAVGDAVKTSSTRISSSDCIDGEAQEIHREEK